MKHVGLNVCADPFVNAAMTGTNGGLVVVAADDPSMHSSQDEQDSRFYGKFAMLPVFEPSSQQEAYDMIIEAFDYSEKEKLPVLMRVTTRMAHSRAVVEVREEAREQNPLNYDSVAANWVLLPVNARRRNDYVTSQQQHLEDDAAQAKTTQWFDGDDHSLGIIACGIAYNYVRECYPEKCPYPILKVTRYPLPKQFVRKRARCGGGATRRRGTNQRCYAGKCPHQGKAHGRPAENRRTQPRLCEKSPWSAATGGTPTL